MPFQVHTVFELPGMIPDSLHITRSFTLHQLCGAPHKLWTHMIAAAELRQAVMNTERIWTIDWLRLPIADYSP